MRFYRNLCGTEMESEGLRPHLRKGMIRRLGAAIVLASIWPAPAGAEIIPWQQLYSGFSVTEVRCREIPEAVWVTQRGQSFCMRYYLSTAGGKGSRPVVFLGGDSPFASLADRRPVPPPDLFMKDLQTEDLFKRADAISTQQGTTAIWLARVGQDGSSGTHHSLRHTLLELLATNAALDAIKQRHGFEGFHVYGHSGGGNLTVGLLLLRGDIGCDVPASGQLTLPNPHGIKIDRRDPARQVFDVTDSVAIIARKRSARLLVVTDPADQAVRIEHQNPFVEKLRKAGGNIDQFFVSSADRLHHGTAGHGAVVMHDCLAGANHDVIAADLAAYTAMHLPANVKPGEQPKPVSRADLGRVLEGVNLRGDDYRSLSLDAAEPALCQKACREDTLCTAWTYVKPGAQGGKPRCWLKAHTPPQTPEPCCTSGVERF